jgi:hypothetical protein
VVLSSTRSAVLSGIRSCDFLAVRSLVAYAVVAAMSMIATIMIDGNSEWQVLVREDGDGLEVGYDLLFLM